MFGAHHVVLKDARKHKGNYYEHSVHYAEVLHFRFDNLVVPRGYDPRFQAFQTCTFTRLV